MNQPHPLARRLGQNEALKAHARQVLPTVLDHPAHAQRLVDKLAVATDA